MQFWSGDHLAIEVSGPGGASEVVVPHPYALVGALARADVRLSGDGVQKREALLYVIGDKIMCRRLEAALPEAYCEVASGEWIPLGKHRLRARIIRNANASPPLEADTKPRIPVMRVRHKARASVNRRLYKTIETVGRNGDCELELHCPKASLYHCVLLRDANRLWCIDLGSGNGTLLNDQRIECALVEIGGRLRVGDFELEFQRYSRRSSAPAGADNASGSHLSLLVPVREERLSELVSRDDADNSAGESIFGSKIINGTATLQGAASSLSGLAALPEPPSEHLQLLQNKQADLLAAQAELLARLEALAAENIQLRADQETLSQHLFQRLEEQRSTLADEHRQQSQSERDTLTSDLLRRMDELRGSTGQELSTQLDSLRQSLEQQWLAHQLESRDSAVRDQQSQTSSLRQALSQELDNRLQQWDQSHAGELSKSIQALQDRLTQVLHERIETLGRSQADQHRSAARAERDALAKELTQRIDDLAASQGQSLKLQCDAQRHALMQELTRRMDAALEGRPQQPAASSDPAQAMVSQQWLQRLDDLRSAQSDEIALAVGTLGQGLSAQLTQRVDDLQQMLAQDLSRQIDEQRRSLSQELSRQLDTTAAQSQELAKAQQDRLDAWQQIANQTLADQVQRQTQALSQELARQAESHAAGARELLVQSNQQLWKEWQDGQDAARSTDADRHQAQADNLNQRIDPLQATVQQMFARQSELIGQLSAQADELETARRELRELQSRPIQMPLANTPEIAPDWQSIELSDTARGTDAALSDSGVIDISGRQEPEFTESPQAPSVAESNVLPERPQRKSSPIDEDDPLLHFVSDRLGQLDTGRQRLTIIYWSAAIAAGVALITVLIWALFTWLPGYWSQG